jgi:parallel beta-helix repeat protein
MPKKFLATTIILATILALVIGIQAVEVVDANFMVDPVPRITINADGSLEPENTPIIRDGQTYSFTSDIVGYNIDVNCDNIVLDGKGYKLIGNSSYYEPAITLEHGRYNIMVKNITYQQIEGFHASGNRNCTIESNTLRGTVEISTQSDNVRVTNNDLSGCYLWLWASNSTVTGNKFAYTEKGINMFECEDCTVTFNTFVNVTNPIEMLPEYNKAYMSNTISPNRIVSHEDPTPPPTQQPTNQTTEPTTGSSFSIIAIIEGGIAGVVVGVVALVSLVYFKRKKGKP